MAIWSAVFWKILHHERTCYVRQPKRLTTKTKKIPRTCLGLGWEFLTHLTFLTRCTMHKFYNALCYSIQQTERRANADSYLGNFISFLLHSSAFIDTRHIVDNMCLCICPMGDIYLRSKNTSERKKPMGKSSKYIFLNLKIKKNNRFVRIFLLAHLLLPIFLGEIPCQIASGYRSHA